MTDRSCRPRFSAFSASPLAKKSGCLTSTPYVKSWGRASRNCQRACRSRGPNVAGSWSQYWPTRFARGDIRVKNSWVKSSQFRSAALWEMVAGNLKQKRKSSVVCSRQRSTISVRGRAYSVVLPSTQLTCRALLTNLLISIMLWCR